MAFSSPLFLFLFLPVVLTVYFCLPGLRSRNGWLLLVSLVFYAWGEIGFIPLLLISTLVNFQLGKWIERSDEPTKRKRIAGVAVAVNVGLLAFYKYVGLIVLSLNALLWLAGADSLTVPHVELPVGISFFTFHAISYIVDIFRRKWPAARDPRDTALYIFFFPQLIAGPILRWNAIAPQLEQRLHDRAQIAEGVRRFVGGFAKKMIVANAVAAPADQIFALPAGELSASVAWFGCLCYTIQIYFDFSGYSDMAVGLGRMFGFQLTENFDFPYISQSIKEFWRRWHISLSGWFRDYVYIPLGGNQVSASRNHFNLVAVFLLCGLWHGASWTFVAWGLFHGMFLVLERTAWGRVLDGYPRPFRHLYTLFVIMMGWVLFRAETFADAAHFIAALFGAGRLAQALPLQRYASKEVLFALGIGAAFGMPLWRAIKTTAAKIGGWVPTWGRVSYFGIGSILENIFTIVLLVISAAWLAGGTYNPFIYYRF